jgi:hypothetical protein
MNLRIDSVSSATNFEQSTTSEPCAWIGRAPTPNPRCAVQGPRLSACGHLREADVRCRDRGKQDSRRRFLVIAMRAPLRRRDRLQV